MRKKRVFSDEDSRSSVPSLRTSVIKHNEAYSASVTYRRLLGGINEDRWMKVAAWEISSPTSATRTGFQPISSDFDRRASCKGLVSLMGALGNRL